MLYWLTPYLSDFFGPFQAFQYIGIRAGLAFIIAFIAALKIGKPLIAHLKKIGVGENVGMSDSHKVGELHKEKKKNDTPTMGGVFWLASILIAMTLCGRLDEPLVLIGMVFIVGMGTIGFFDDQIKANPEDPRNGMSRSTKMSATVLLSVLTVTSIWQMGNMGSGYPELRYIYFPLFKDAFLGEGWNILVWAVMFFVIELVFILAFSHAVNVTDGLDGLAAGSAVPVLIALAMTTYFVGHAGYADYLNLPFIPGAGEVTVIVAATLGATLGFLWFNINPALIFLGDSGALPLGAAMAYFALVSKQEILMIFMAGVFTFELLSSFLQIIWYKLTGARLFLIAPAHHIWEEKKMPEARIVVRFWIVSSICAVASLISIKLR